VSELPVDAILFLSFGGPEGPDDVMPFLQNVLRGRSVPAERLREVARHYDLFGGVSPLNGQNRALISALEAELAAHGPALPVYWGNRNWHPLLEDTLRRMTEDGVRRALAFVSSAFSSYSGCRQYREDVERARAAVGAQAPVVEKLRAFYDHPGFIEANAERVRTALAHWPAAARAGVSIAFTAHSIPLAMASGCAYQAQLQETCGLLAESIGGNPWALAFQSRSGPPSQPWLEPDIGEQLRRLHASGARDLVVSPLGFLSDHMEVVYDLDTEAAALAKQLGVTMRRAATPGTHPAIVAMIRELILERVAGAAPRALGGRGPLPPDCPADCCLPTNPARPAPRA